VAWLENDFKVTLHNQATLEQWVQWLERVVDRVIKPFESGSTQEFVRVARQFLLKWSFYRCAKIKSLIRPESNFKFFKNKFLVVD
jgi:regulatory factor X 1/2/3